MPMHTIYWISEDKTQYHLCRTFKIEEEANNNIPLEKRELLRTATSDETRRMIEAGSFVVCEEGE
jgi:hypothetical protein